ncbi:hypothetical protein M885DRAFT_510723 [Pelagophyceae sp. CCMP2097]|nr:hypothetical protein M885DRAFT_510723 [Pelagophyceae sp. CCMP2097]
MLGVVLGCGLRVDVCVNNFAALCNTEALRLVADREPAFATLVRCARAWARTVGVSGSKQRRLSSYAWAVVCLAALRDCGDVGAVELATSREMSLRTQAPQQLSSATGLSALRAAVAADVSHALAGGALDDGDEALGRRFSHLLRLITFRKADVLSPRAAGTAHRLKAPPLKHRDRLRIEDPVELDRDLASVLTRKSASALRYGTLARLATLAVDDAA